MIKSAPKASTRFDLVSLKKSISNFDAPGVYDKNVLHTESHSSLKPRMKVAKCENQQQNDYTDRIAKSAANFPRHFGSPRLGRFVHPNLSPATRYLCQIYSLLLCVLAGWFLSVYAQKLGSLARQKRQSNFPRLIALNKYSSFETYEQQCRNVNKIEL